MNPGIRTVAAALTGLTVILSGCGRGSAPSGAQAAGGGSAPEVEVLIVAPAPATQTREWPGRLLALHKAEVRARVDGVVEKRLFKEGSWVRAGQPLFSIDYGLYQAALAAARASADLARLTLARHRALLKEGAVSQQELDQSLAAHQSAQAALSKAQLDAVNARVGAPISGYIGRALVTQGALVSKSEATSLALIENTDRMSVDFTESYSDLLKLTQDIAQGKSAAPAQGAQVELLLEDGSVYPLPGRLVAADRSIDPNTGSMTVRAEFPNPQHTLMSGAFVRVRVAHAQLPQAIRIPQRALQASAQGQSVTIVDQENKTAVRPVKTEGMSGEDWLVSEGLAAGDRVVVHGLQKIKPGMVVAPAPWNAQATQQAAQQAMAGMAGSGQSSTKAPASAPAAGR
jgi:membrane fusion protein (multidrug efflux system)